MPPAANSVDFASYLALLRDCSAAVRGLSVFDRDLEPLWSGGDATARREAFAAGLEALRDGDLRGLSVDGASEGRLDLLRLDDEHGQLLLALGLHLGPGDDAAPLHELPAIRRLAGLLATDYCRSVALAAREDELDFMTDELTRRYEELNLIYKAEDQAINIHHGRELLRQLVFNTSRFLNVDVVYLFIADRNVDQHKLRADRPVFGADALFECLREKVLPVLSEDGAALVVNRAGEARQRGIECELPLKLVASPIVNSEAEVIGLLAIASQHLGADFTNSDRNLLDVMAKKASKITQSHFDPLTGLENSNSFELILNDLLRQSRGQQARHAIANVDIDRLAVVNDISGREAGDWLIKQIGRTLAATVRNRDVVARVGSDKFGILLKDCDLATARAVMKKISHAVSSIDMEWNGEPHEVSVSIGIAPVDPNAQTVTSLLNAAETARNLGKERGRNSIHVLEMEDTDLLQRKEQIRWVSRIQSALRENRFLLYAQAIDPLAQNRDKPHYELLLRLRGEDGEIVPPGRFLPAAETFYLMSSIDYWVIDRAFADLWHLNRDGRGCAVSINISGQSLGDPTGFGAYIENKFDQYGQDPADICFEITESAAIANLDDACVFIDQVHQLGCRFSLDDFGTGLSSFAYLKNLNVDYLKIDGSFVRDILSDPVCESMVGAINQVGHAMNLQIVAEFVENDAIRQKLARLGVDFGQGFAIDKPKPFREIPLPRARSA